MTTRFSLLLLAAASAWAQSAVKFEDRDGLLLSNDKIELIVMSKGGAFASLTLRDDSSKMNPMWNPAKIARDAGQPSRFGDSLGHFVCVDGFGPTSKDEQAAGLEGHGEAHRLPWEQVRAARSGKALVLTQRVKLPVLQEIYSRTIEMSDGENVVAVTSDLVSLVGFDRPANWAEHGTIGSPFLEPEKTVVDASVGRCQTRPHVGNGSIRRLADTKEFTYPMAPLRDGTLVNLRSVPSNPNSMDHTGCAMDPSRRLVFVTALNTDKKLLIGYLFRREEYPWLQEWMNYTGAKTLARGLEFGTQPYDVPRRQTVDMGTSLFGIPAFRWLPAKGGIGTKYLMFYTRVPAGMTKVDDVRLEGGQLVIEDKAAGKTVSLPTAQTL